jgi:hypothetical protein
MRSMIFSALSGIALTLLMRGPTPAPQPCHIQAVAQQVPAEAIPARVIEALQDSLPSWLAGLDIRATGVAVVGRDSTAAALELRTSLTGLSPQRRPVSAARALNDPGNSRWVTPRPR